MQGTALVRLSVSVFCAGAVLGVFLGPPAYRSTAKAQVSGCTLASLSGSYGFAGSGTVLIGESGGPEPHGSTRLQFVEGGRSVFDGQGGVAVTADTRDVEGQVYQVQGSGTYTVSADCTGSTSLSFSDGSKGHDAFVIVGGGDEFQVVGSDPGLIRTATAKRQ
jgi:hypothetical protein